jgi:hypothetical protein
MKVLLLVASPMEAHQAPASLTTRVIAMTNRPVENIGLIKLIPNNQLN